MSDEQKDVAVKFQTPEVHRELLPFIPIHIPDAATVESSLSLIPQTLGVNYSELQGYFDWIQEKSGEVSGLDLVGKAALMTINNLNPDVAGWEAVVMAGEDANYTVGRCIREEKNSCFQRAIMFQLLMQQVGIPSAVKQGRWIESVRKDIRDQPDTTKMIAGGVRIGDEDKEEGHVWNIIQVDEISYLVDTSYLINEEGKPNPVIHKIALRPDLDPTNIEN